MQDENPPTRLREEIERVGTDQSGGEKAWGRPYCGLPILKGGCWSDEEGLCSRECSGRLRGDGFKLREGRFRLDTRTNFFTVRVVKHWPRLRRRW